MEAGGRGERHSASLEYLGCSGWQGCWALGGLARSTQRGGIEEGSRRTWSHMVRLESWLLHLLALTSLSLSGLQHSALCLSGAPLEARCQP